MSEPAKLPIKREISSAVGPGSWNPFESLRREIDQAFDTFGLRSWPPRPLFQTDFFRDKAWNIAIVVDDGKATGATMKAALRGVRQSEPSRLVLAAPVAPGSVVSELEPECDEMIFLATPELFYAVGSYYTDFSQTAIRK